MKTSLQHKKTSAHEVSRPVTTASATVQAMEDNRPERGRMRQLMQLAQNNPVQLAFKDEEQLTDAPHNPAHTANVGQRMAIGAAAAQAAQRVEDEETAPAQRVAHDSASPTRSNALPAQLQAGIESLSGMSMAHVNVHYNSPQPAQLNAHAFAQGSDIHLAAGQERHLPHEAWHVVQQAQGRVQPTMQMKAGVSINDDRALEQEADVMGARAQAAGQTTQRRALTTTGSSGVAQRQTLTQTGDHGALGLTESADVQSIKDDDYDHPAAKVYHDNTVVAAADQGDALTKVAVRAAGIANGLVDKAKTFAPPGDAQFQGKVGKRPNGYFYSPKTATRGLATEKALDPFAHLTTATLPEDKTLKLQYQHTYGYDGYVSKIEEGTTAGGVSMTATMSTKNKPSENKVAEYKRQHETTGDAKLSEHAAGDTDQRFDAITKLAGEGARFVWVREQQDTITDHTTFEVKADEAVEASPILTITFQNLWVTWKDWFAGAYGIPNEDIKAVLRDQWKGSGKPTVGEFGETRGTKRIKIKAP